MKEKLELLTRIPESAIERAALTFLNLHDSWEWATREERKMLVQTMIQEAGCDVGAERIVGKSRQGGQNIDTRKI